MLRALLAIALAAAAQVSETPQALLDRASRKISANLGRLPNYTCVQTLTRSYAEDSNPAVVLSSCSQIADSVADREKSSLTVSWLDRLHFDVAVSEGREIFSWAGDKQFQSNRNADFAEEGTIGTGDFAGFITTIFGGHNATFDYQGRRDESGVSITEFAYKVPVAKSSYLLRSAGASYQVGFHGTFALDSASGDLRRLTAVTDDPPAATKICEATTTMEYGEVKIGSGTFLLPRSTELIVLGSDGAKSDNKTSYTSCRQYLGESKIHFEDVADDQPTARVKKTLIIPAGLKLDIRLKSPIDSDTMMAGDAITGSLTKPLKDQSGQTLLQGDAIVRGRIVRMQKRLKPNQVFVVSLRFESVELPDASAALELTPVIDKNGGGLNKPGKDDLKALEYSTRNTKAAGQTLGTYLFPGGHLLIHAGALTHWKTIRAAE